MEVDMNGSKQKGLVAVIGTMGTNTSKWTPALLGCGFTVRSLVRTPVVALAPGQTQMRFDLEDKSGYEGALGGADILALVTPPHPDQVARETALIAAAEAAGVKRIVNLSTLGADLPEPITAFARWQREIETALARSSVPAVTLRPNFFMQNILAQRSAIRSGIFAQPWGAFAMSVIDVSDVAEVAASVADGSHDGTAIDLTGPEALTGEEMAALLARAVGYPVAFVSPDLADFRAALDQQHTPAWMIDALVEIYGAMAEGRAQHLSHVSDGVPSVLKRPGHSFETFVRDQL